MSARKSFNQRRQDFHGSQPPNESGAKKSGAPSAGSACQIGAEIERHRTKYANKWTSIDAAHNESKGYYDWMASFVDPYSVILEIGCGDGRSTLELAKRGHRVVSVDENPACIQLASERLLASGVKAQVANRESVKQVAERVYKINYTAPGLSIPDNGVLLLTGDVMDDPSLHEWLKRIGPFDAVVCWLIGTHNARFGHAVIIQKKVTSAGEYRLRVQNQTYELADEILRSGGVLHIVDRGELPPAADVDSFVVETVGCHRDQAAPTSLQINAPDVAFLPFEKPDDPSGVKLVKTLGSSGRDPGEVPMALWSTVAHKP